jgi:hypothetical protein
MITVLASGDALPGAFGGARALKTLSDALGTFIGPGGQSVQ